MKQSKNNVGQNEAKKMMRIFSNVFGAKKNTIPTAEISSLVDKIECWIDLGNTGAIVYGDPRIGKTRAIEYLETYIHEEYGPEFPVFRWDANLIRIQKNPKNFYQAMLLKIGFSNFKKTDSVLVLKDMLVNALIALGRTTDHSKLVFIVDEAQHLTYNDFTAMIELYNLLDKNDINLTTLLVGDNRLKDLKRLYQEKHYDQIIGRFMIHEHQFHGVTSPLAMMFVLDTFDQMEYKIDVSRTIQISKDFFPEGYKKGWRLKDMAADFWNIFMDVCDPAGKGLKDIPMEYITQALLYLIKRHSIMGDDPVEIPSALHIKEAIEFTDFQYRSSDN